MKEDVLLAILFGIVFKLTDEVIDIPVFSAKFAEYSEALKVTTMFLYGLQATNDFYYNFIWLIFSIFSYIAKSIDTDFWKVCGFLTLFATLWTFSWPLPDTHYPTLIGFILFASSSPILDNFIAPGENNGIKLIESIFVLLGILFVFFFFQQDTHTYDLRFVYKHLGWFLGYFLTRVITKFYLYYTDNSETYTIKND